MPAFCNKGRAPPPAPKKTKPALMLTLLPDTRFFNCTFQVLSAACLRACTSWLSNSSKPSFFCNESTKLRVKEPKSTSLPKRSEEHTSELQSRPHLVCRLLLEKKKKK